MEIGSNKTDVKAWQGEDMVNNRAISNNPPVPSEKPSRAPPSRGLVTDGPMPLLKWLWVAVVKGSLWRHW